MAKTRASEEREAKVKFQNELMRMSDPRTSVEIENASKSATLASASTMADGTDPSLTPVKSKKDSKPLTSYKPKPKNEEKPKGRFDFRDLPFAEQKVYFGNQLTHSFAPLKYLMLVFGRFPLTSKKNKALGTSTFSWTWGHPNCIYFMFTSVATMYVLLIGTLNVFDIQMETDVFSLGNFMAKQKTYNGTGKFKLGNKFVPGSKEGREQIGGFNYEKIIFERHVATFALIWGLLVHSVVASINLIGKREYAVMYFSFWYRAVQTMHMDVTLLARRKTMTMTIGYSIILVIITLFSLFKVGPSTQTAPTLFGILMFREYFPPLYILNTTIESWSSVSSHKNLTNFTYYSIINNAPASRHLMALLGGLFLLLLFSGSITHMFLFVYKCDLLRNAFANWNGRLYAVVMKGTDHGSNKVVRASYEHLFRDHCILLDVMEGNDRLFAGCVESYYAVQIVTLFFQMYFMIRVSVYGEDRQGGAADGGRYYIRPFDWAPAVVLLALSVVILICVTLAASDVGDEAMSGLEILRRKSLLHRKSDKELYFTLSMLSSYTSYKHLQVSAAGYCYFNKEFLIAIVSTIFSYFIIIFQFRPSLDHQTIGDWDRREVAGKFLSELEGIRPLDHWKAKS